MKRLLAVFLLALLLPACSMIGLGDSSSMLETTEYGIFKDGRLDMQTNGVPMAIGTTFGFRFKVAQSKSGPVKARIVTATPGLIDPSKSKVQTDYVSELTLDPGQTYDVFFTFSEPWELVSGHWELRVETDKGETLSQKFDVYKQQM
ncbi:DUF3859 domain-containing protein [Fundidesulfovibrio terrae]|uniref:DUF3859 domain-containing protein n=1 Tax=Fundidesulfovibrio terrae TaxID=2922866 RepID=UPI001FAEF2DB|nr:DUF3859 domain-containing protein [Fundidesulfovibrio terrae]